MGELARESKVSEAKISKYLRKTKRDNDMKKKYISPNTYVVRLATQKLLALSDLTGMQENESFSVSVSNEEFDGEAASRQFNVWDDK
jgi:hypothetical protein